MDATSDRSDSEDDVVPKNINNYKRLLDSDSEEETKSSQNPSSSNQNKEVEQPSRNDSYETDSDEDSDSHETLDPETKKNVEPVRSRVRSELLFIDHW